MRNFTPEDLIAFHYNESSLTDLPAVAEALDNHWPLQEKYRVIKESSRTLDKALTSPRRQSVEAILSYGVAAMDASALE